MSKLALTWDDARSLTDEVKADTRTLWLKLERLYEGGAHTALGFKSWHAYCAVEFNLGSARAYQLLDAGRVAQILANSTSVEPASEAVARELAPLREDPEAMAAAMGTAVELHGASPTAAQVREVVRGPGDDIRYSRIENAASSLQTLPALDKLLWPVEPGDVAAMDESFAFLSDWLPAAKASWRAHKARLKRGKHLRAA